MKQQELFLQKKEEKAREKVYITHHESIRHARIQAAIARYMEKGIPPCARKQ